MQLDPTDKIAKERRRQAEALRKSTVLPKEQIIEVLGTPEVRGPGDAVKITFGTNPGKDSTPKGSIPFDYDKYDIRDDAKPQLQELGQALVSPQLSQYVFEIAGHTDRKGPDAYNRELSWKRADAVKNYLVQQFRIPEGQLKVKGYGKSRLVTLDDNEAAHAVNRRVEVTRIGSAGEETKSPPGKKAEVPAAKMTRLSLEVGFLYQDGQTGRRRQIMRDGSTTLRTGKNPYQVFFRPAQASYVYLLQKDSANQWCVLFPVKGSAGHSNPVQPGKDYWVPGFDTGFRLDDTTGQETLYLLASARQIPELESPVEVHRIVPGGRGAEPSSSSTTNAVCIPAAEVYPIVRGTETRGIASIGKPVTLPQAGCLPDCEPVVTKLTGDGAFVEIISFEHK